MVIRNGFRDVGRQDVHYFTNERVAGASSDPECAIRWRRARVLCIGTDFPIVVGGVVSVCRVDLFAVDVTRTFMAVQSGAQAGNDGIPR